MDKFKDNSKKQKLPLSATMLHLYYGIITGVEQKSGQNVLKLQLQ
jgi:hypothetical protein